MFLDLNGYELYEADETELADILIGPGSGVIGQGEFFDGGAVKPIRWASEVIHYNIPSSSFIPC